MAVFLKVHADVVVEDEEVRMVVAEWRGVAEEETRRVERLSEFCGGLVGYLRAARV